MELIHFDIETVGEHPNFKTFKEKDERGSNLFKGKYDVMKWEEKYGSIEKAYLENAGIVSPYGKIVCISTAMIKDDGTIGTKSYYGDNEKNIVNSFNELVKKVEKKMFNLSGFRIKYFDIPWVLHKLHKYGIEPANMIYAYDKKPWEMRLTDMSDDWRQRFAWYFSFDEMCYELGVESPKKDLSGSGVHKAYWSGDIEKVKDYCEKDVIASVQCGEKIYRNL